MLKLALICFLTVSPALGHRTPSEVPCKSVADCWLEEGGKPVKRPKKLKGRKVPRGDCGSHLLWLRNRLSCEQGVCTATFQGDKC